MNNLRINGSCLKNCQNYNILYHKNHVENHFIVTCNLSLFNLIFFHNDNTQLFLCKLFYLTIYCYFKKSLYPFSFFVFGFFSSQGKIFFLSYFSLYFYLAYESLSGMWMCVVVYMYIVLRPHTKRSGWDVGAYVKILALIFEQMCFKWKKNQTNKKHKINKGKVKT
mgnify:CR=1 FL=1